MLSSKYLKINDANIPTGGALHSISLRGLRFEAADEQVEGTPDIPEGSEEWKIEGALDHLKSFS